jgi:hypothetical protein
VTLSLINCLVALELLCVIVVMGGRGWPQEFVDQCAAGEFLSTDFYVDGRTPHVILALVS